MAKILFSGECNRPPDELIACADYARTLGLPFVVEAERVHERPLAIVGGGPSINENVETLRGWPGDVWAVNGAIKWATERGIDATFFTIDPETYKHTPRPFFEAVKPGGEVLASVRCPPDMFDYLIGIGADVRLFEVIYFGSTGVAVAAKMACMLGYVDVTFFGAESSYHGSSHAYDDIRIHDLIRVECGGEAFLTKPELLLQAQWLSAVVREMPDVFKERSGGLLRAMAGARDGDDYEIVAVSPEIHKGLALCDRAAS